MDSEELSFMTVEELAPLIAARKVSPVELVDAQLSRIEAMNDVLRAFIYYDGDQARALARAAADEIAAGGYRGPLHGVTVAHKDIIDVQGMPTTGGSVIMKDYMPATEATVQARLRAAGAICLGKLNLVEFASGSMGPYGYARNPHNLAASPGGSSSGSGVAAAAGLSTIVTGTDTGGSVRNPSSFDGLAGLRPTYGRVSRYGCVPLSWSQDSIGPMGRSVYDIAVMLGVMAGPDRLDASSARLAVPDFTESIDRGAAGLRVGVPEAYFFEDLHPEVEAAVRKAVEDLRALGAEIIPIELPSAVYASAASWTIAYSESFVHHHDWFIARSRDYTPPFLHKITAAGMTSSVERIVSQRIRQVVTREMVDALTRVDVILTPTARFLASTPPGGDVPQSPTLRWSSDMSSVTRQASLAGLPALSVQAGVAADATPIGMQLIGRPWEEATLFRLGAAYERELCWNKRRPGPWPAELPPRFGAGGAPARTSEGPVTPAWVMDMARLLDYEFVTEDDAKVIAPMLSGVKDQLAAAKKALKLSVEPPTRASGLLTT